MTSKAPSVQTLAKPEPNDGLKGSSDGDTSKNTGHIVVTPIDDVPVIQVSLTSRRFAAKIFLSVGVFVAVLSVFAHGVTIDKNVHDQRGSSLHADRWMGIYQTTNGFFTTLIGTAFGGYVTMFIAVATTFLRNVRWYPGDDPAKRPSCVKRLVLWALCPLVMYNVRVAVTAMFVSHKMTGVARIFLPEDLIISTGALTTPVLNAKTAVNFTSTGNGVSVLDTILRGAVLQRVDPFELDPNSPCAHVNTIANEPRTELPTVKEARSTAVVYGFPTRSWNVDALPFGLIPNHSFSLNVNNASVSVEDDARFRNFQNESMVSWRTIYDTFLQGKLLYERSVSDADASVAYPCVLSDRHPERDRRANDSSLPGYDTSALFREGEYKGKRRCFGAVSTLEALRNTSDPTMHTVEAFLLTVIDGFVSTTPQVEPESANVTLEVYNINPQLKLTSMTLDMAYYTDRQYRNTNDTCDKDSKLRSGILASYRKRGITVDEETLRKRLCDKDQYAYVNPRAACGHSNCIFLDQSKTIPFEKQLQLVPYMTNCSTEDLTYDSNFHNFFPIGCVPVKNAAFLYGLGSYMAGDVFDSGSQTGFPFISNPRRHIMVTFAKLEWQFGQINSTFEAKCGVNATVEPARCSGLIYNLENVSVPALKVNSYEDTYRRVLVLGASQLPTDLRVATFFTPVQLLSLNSRSFFYPKSKEFYEWEYLALKHFKSTDWLELQRRGGLDGRLCSPLVDAYISMLESNKYFMDDPRQPLYTAALFYLFQNAAVKTILQDRRYEEEEQNWWFGEKTNNSAIVNDRSIRGTTTLKGDFVEQTITWKISLSSLLFTFAGLIVLRVLTIIAMVTPTQRLRMTDAPEENVAHQYARLRQEDEYPRQVFDRGLLLPTGTRLTMDNYVVEHLALHHKDNASQKIVL